VLGVVLERARAGAPAAGGVEPESVSLPVAASAVAGYSDAKGRVLERVLVLVDALATGRSDERGRALERVLVQVDAPVTGHSDAKGRA